MLAILAIPLFLGDSLMAQVGPKIPPPATVVAKVGSGLANPRLKDWSTFTFTPGAPVVVIMGTNDGQNIRGFACGTPGWTREYRVRVGGLMAKAQPGRMLWVIPGRTGSSQMDGRLDHVRSAIQAEALSRGVKVLDLRAILGETQTHNPLHHSRDRVHLNPKGVALVAAAIKACL